MYKPVESSVSKSVSRGSVWAYLRHLLWKLVLKEDYPRMKKLYLWKCYYNILYSIKCLKYLVELKWLNNSNPFNEISCNKVKGNWVPNW